MDAQNKDKLESFIIIGGKLLAAVLLFWCVEQHPYAYYKRLRWIISIVGFFTAGMYFGIAGKSKSNKTFWTWIGVFFGVIVLLFNPLIPFTMARDTWVIIDIITGVIFVIAIFIDIIYANTFRNEKE